MDKVLFFITPGPLTERFYFSIRVLVSWLTSYSFIGLGLAFWLASVPTSTKTNSSFNSPTFPFAFALAMCFYAFIALGIDAYLGRKPAHYGWYWWLYPIIACFWVPIFIILLIFGVAGKSSSSSNHTGSPNKKPPIDPKQSSGDFLKRHSNDLDKYQEQVEGRINQGQYNNDEIERHNMRKRIMAKLRADLKASIGSILTEREIAELVTMIIEMST